MSGEQKHPRYLDEEDLAFLREVEKYYDRLRQHPELIEKYNKLLEGWNEYFLNQVSRDPWEDFEEDQTPPVAD